MRELKEYEDLIFSDRFMFFKVMSDNPELCGKLAELVTGRETPPVVTMLTEQTDEAALDGGGVRFEAYFEGEEDVAYDFVLQVAEDKNIGKYTRYCQWLLDKEFIEHGAGDNALLKSYIVLICLEDPFGRGLHRYTFENRCAENLGVGIGDEACKVFLNAGGTKGDVPDGVKYFLAYVRSNCAEDEFTKEIDAAVQTAKKDEEGKRMYMELLGRIRENFEKGCEEGERSFLALIRRLIADGKTSEVIRVAEDKELRQEWYRKYNIV